MLLVRRRNHTAFQEYGLLLERLLEGFTKEEGVSVEEVALACQKWHQRDRADAMASVDYVIAAIEYDEFVHLAYDFFELTGGAS